jgi:hypothetical protein
LASLVFGENLSQIVFKTISLSIFKKKWEVYKWSNHILEGSLSY